MRSAERVAKILDIKNANEVLDLLDSTDLEPPANLTTLTAHMWRQVIVRFGSRPLITFRISRTHLSICSSASEVQGMAYSNFGVLFRVLNETLGIPGPDYIARYYVL
ncbi:hypothetical protein SeMB42_g02695 [Synchytrium endobioticum]|uniref:Uncharacterized protein n=1 Tax=Synchytrium endobioticum TaxID=286115 RepID=A0A507D3K5_9FUNG|nr:hypothetical protein SeLEV6574_g03456 [Synchytrium endobioticum]TPX49235.1 hypothetical protein SeMB42_g02695 [Synchytrium endobioticum]